MNTQTMFKKYIFLHLKDSRKERLKQIKDYFIKEEEQFHETIDRCKYYVKGKRKRRIFTPLGDIIIERRIYLDRAARKCKILFDEFIGLDPWAYVQKYFYPFFTKVINLVTSYKALMKMLKGKISSYQITKMMKQQDFYFNPTKLTNKVKKLTINMDGFYVLENKASKYEVKFAVMYTDTVAANKRINKKKKRTKARKTHKRLRKKLVNKTLIPFKKGAKTDDIAIILDKYIKYVYGEVEEIVIIGDGATWITGVADQLNARREIDQYHYTQFIKNLVGKRNKVDWNLIQNETVKNVHKYIESQMMINHKIRINYDTGEALFTKAQIENIAKMRKFLKSYQRCYNEGLTNAIEGIQASQIAETMKCRRAFSQVVGHKVIMLNVARYNNWEITTELKDGMINFSDIYESNSEINLYSRTLNPSYKVPAIEIDDGGISKILNDIIY